MYDLILQLVLMISLGIIVYLMAIAVPRIEDGGGKKGGRNNQAIHISLDRMDVFLTKAKDKGLRRIKVLIMKADNYVGRQLNKDEEKL